MVNYIVIAILCIALAARDGLNYYIFGKPYKNMNRLSEWHILGGCVYAAGCGLIVHNWYGVAFAAVFRFGIYDLVHNIFAHLPPGHIGTTATTDKITKWLFKNAIIKAAVSLAAIAAIIWIGRTTK